MITYLKSTLVIYIDSGSSFFKLKYKKILFCKSIDHFNQMTKQYILLHFWGLFTSIKCGKALGAFQLIDTNLSNSRF